MRLGYFLSSEEWGPRELVEQATKAQRAGFDRLWISDHYHPWNDEQGHSPFVWSVIGAIAAGDRRHEGHDRGDVPDGPHPPAIIAQAAATSAVLLDGRFGLGVGSGEALNEHILGDRWPEADERLEMLEEAVEVIRAALAGRRPEPPRPHYRVEHARIYDLPESRRRSSSPASGPSRSSWPRASATATARSGPTRTRSSSSARRAARAAGRRAG